MKHGVSLERREGKWKSQPEGGDGDGNTYELEKESGGAWQQGGVWDLYTTSRWVG
jgi:hypothetical protein